jgi:hypothetical protein
MAAIPLFEEAGWSAAGPMIAGLAGFQVADPNAPVRLESRGEDGAQRRFSVYPASAAFQLTTELEHLSRRAIEPNIFFNPRFMAPAMPRLEDRDVRIAVLRDDNGRRTRLRFVMPYTVQRPAGGVGPAIIRSWSNVFGPNGTPLIDGDDATGVAEELLDILARPHLNLPEVLVLPHLDMDGPAARTLRAAALARDYPVFTAATEKRAVLNAGLDGPAHMAAAFTAHHRRGYGRLWRRLGESGGLDFTISRGPDAIFSRMEEFLLLEDAGWKGRKRTSLLSDRMQSAFARETVNSFAERDMVRIMTLDLGGRAIASLIVLMESGVAYTWKIAFDETLEKFSPGMLLMIETTKALLEDPNMTSADSCAVPDHPMMDRVWTEHKTLQTLIIGLGPATDRVARQVQGQIDIYGRTRIAARGMRNKWRSMMGAWRPEPGR